MATNVIPSDEPSVFAALSGQQLGILAYPSPLPPGLAGLVFDIVGDERLTLRSEITDNWVEDNTAVHDQIALPPERFSVDATTAELVFAPPVPQSAPPQPANPLPINGNFVPALTPGAQAAQDANAVPRGGAANGTASLWTYYKGLQSAAPTKQALVVGYIYQLWLGRVRFTVETPWGIMRSMVIESAESVQSSETNQSTDHRLTFKKFRIARELTVEPAPAVGRALNQAAEADPSLNGNVGQTTLDAQTENQVLGGWVL